MAAFAYTAINADGFQLDGEVHAPDTEAAREQLRIRGLLASRLDELPASGEEGARTAFKKIKPKTLQIFSRQFATMIEAGLNVVTSLVILETLVLIGLLMFLVPVFVKIFGQLGGQLPTLTQYVVNASNLLRHDWFIIFPVMIGSIFGVKRLKKTEKGRQVWDRIKLK